VNRVVAPEELVSVAQGLAADMLTVVPECLPAYKKLIDDGFAEAFGDALKTELKVSGAANSSVSADALESRRAGIQKRGKTQTA